ncbi:hypothetical protein, partial [Acidocella aminolytica]|uniref:hypothetical protein n=1 Tax=Acidocella aminolytica TaxID=33998 RepID=UPI0022302E79
MALHHHDQQPPSVGKEAGRLAGNLKSILAPGLRHSQERTAAEGQIRLRRGRRAGRGGHCGCGTHP